MHGAHATLATLLASAALAAAPGPVRPNILLILTDQQSADAMSCRLGDRWLRTPHMDGLATRGIMFTRAYVASPLCVPSRTSLFTGRYPHETGNVDNDIRPLDPKKFPPLGTAFHDAGYDTGYVGKWHMAYPEDALFAHGFEYRRHLRSNGFDHAFPAAAAEFLAKPRTKPFLLVASFINPHNICEWARGDPLPDGPIGEPPATDLCPPLPVNHAPPVDETDAMLFMRRSYQATTRFPVGNFSPEKWRQYLWAYYRLIEKSDAGIGAVLAALRASGHERDTLIVFTADHGDAQGAHGWNQKTVFYDESSRVPFIVCAPGETETRARTSDRLVQTGIDLLPTLCDYAGIHVPTGLPGQSARAATSRRYIVAENRLAQGGPVDGISMILSGRMVRSDRYKYCLYNQGVRRESLVDMVADPGEMKNLADDPALASVRDEHRRMLAEWSRETGDTFPLILPSQQ